MLREEAGKGEMLHRVLAVLAFVAAADAFVPTIQVFGASCESGLRNSRA